MKCLAFSSNIFYLASFKIDNFAFSFRLVDIITITGKLLEGSHFVDEFIESCCFKSSYYFLCDDD